MPSTDGQLFYKSAALWMCSDSESNERRAEWMADYPSFHYISNQPIGIWFRLIRLTVLSIIQPAVTENVCAHLTDRLECQGRQIVIVSPRRYVEPSKNCIRPYLVVVVSCC